MLQLWQTIDLFGKIGATRAAWQPIRSVDVMPSTPSASVRVTEEPSGDDEVRNGWRIAGLWVTGAYAVGLLLMLFRLVIGWNCSARVRKRAAPITEGVWWDMMLSIRLRFRMHSEVAIAWSREVAAPVVIGVLKPTILLPLALATRLSPAQVHAVLIHELAHLQRRDHWWLVIQRLAETVLFFHPAIWWMSRRMDALREDAWRQ